jgi:hypothetical protein
MFNVKTYGNCRRGYTVGIYVWEDKNKNTGALLTILNITTFWWDLSSPVTKYF